MIEGTGPVGKYKSVLWRSGEIAQRGNFRAGIFVGLSMAQSAEARCKRPGTTR